MKSSIVRAAPSSEVRRGWVIAAIDRDPTWKVDRFSRYLRGEAVPCWPIEDALTTLSVIEALFASATLGRCQDIAD